MAPYPTKDQIEDIFAQRSRPDRFNSFLDGDVDVTIPGEDFNCSGKHQGLQAFHEGTWGRVVVSTLKEDTFRVEVIRVIGGGDSAWAAVETVHTAESKNGKCLDPTKNLSASINFSLKPYKNNGIFLVRFNLEGKIVQLKQFGDTRHIHGHVEEYEKK